MQFVRCDEAFARLQSCETKSARLFHTALQRLRFSTMFHSDAAEAAATYVSCLSISTLFLRSPQTRVQQLSRLRQADVAMRSVQRVNTLFSQVFVIMMMRNVRGVESKKTREDFARTSFNSSYNQPIALRRRKTKRRRTRKNEEGAY